jgi:hypothetical protein
MLAHSDVFKFRMQNLSVYVRHVLYITLCSFTVVTFIAMLLNWEANRDNFSQV